MYFHSRVKYIAAIPEDKTDNKQVFLNIELLDEAISNNRKVMFKYAEYGTDKNWINVNKVDKKNQRKLSSA